MSTEELFGDMKAIQESEIAELVKDDSKVFERKYDGTAGAFVASRAGDTVSANIIGRGMLKSGEQQEYSDTFFDLIPSAMKFMSKACHTSITLIGEIVCLDENGNESFKAIESRCTRKKDREKYAEMYPAKFMIFDILELDGRDLRAEPFATRRSCLEYLSEFILGSERFVLIEQQKTVDAKKFLLDRVVSGKYGIEGIVVKDLNAFYPDNIMKFKYKRTEDVFWEGECEAGRNRNEGKIRNMICYQYINGVKTQVAKVGNGLTDVLRNQITEMAKSGEISPENPRVLEIQTHELLPSGKMRYPNFVRWRIDKAAVQCVRALEIVPTKRETKEKAKKAKVVVVEEQGCIDDWL